MEKLKQGDYVTNLTEEQFRELERIEGKDHEMPYFGDGNDLIRHCGFVDMLFCDAYELITELPFDVFKERAINTFKK
jgi:hypothetical protein